MAHDYHRAAEDLEASMNATIQAPISEKAVAIDKQFRDTWGTLREGFYDLGELAETMYREELYKFLFDDDGKPFESGDDWLYARIPEKGRSTVYRARKMSRELAIIPRDERRQIKQCNAPVMAQLSDQHKRDPKWVKAAQTLPEKEFVAKVKSELPEQHVEQTTQTKLKNSNSQQEIFDETIKMCQFVHKVIHGEIPTREEAIEEIFNHWRISPCEAESFQGRTNQEAYDSQHEK